MEKVLYYVVEPELNDLNEWTGHDVLTTYSIENNVPKQQFEIYNSVDEFGAYFYSHEEAIQNYLDENGMGDDEYRFERLQGSESNKQKQIIMKLSEKYFKLRNKTQSIFSELPEFDLRTNDKMQDDYGDGEDIEFLFECPSGAKTDRNGNFWLPYALVGKDSLGFVKIAYTGEEFGETDIEYAGEVSLFSLISLIELYEKYYQKK